MVDRQTIVFRSVLDAAYVSGLHRLLPKLAQGRGIVFTLHSVNPAPRREFDPNYLLGITPVFLEQAIVGVREHGFDCVTLDEAVRRLQTGDTRKFVSFTFDDGYRSVRDLALPVFRKHRVPLTLFVTTAFADGSGDLWWLRLEHILRVSASLEVEIEGVRHILPTATDELKKQAWDRLYWYLRELDEASMRAAVTRIARDNAIDVPDFSRQLCMDWNELREVVKEPLVTIGSHTVNHYMLAKWPKGMVADEFAGSIARIEKELGVTPSHLAYPVGDVTSAAQREFELAREAGFTAAWTTRPGHLFAGHADHLMALPRVSLNGLYQQRRYLDVFLSGLPFMLWNKFRKINVG